MVQLYTLTSLKANEGNIIKKPLILYPFCVQTIEPIKPIWRLGYLKIFSHNFDINILHWSVAWSSGQCAGI